jgi:hypothetical protein
VSNKRRSPVTQSCCNTAKKGIGKRRGEGGEEGEAQDSQVGGEDAAKGKPSAALVKRLLDSTRHAATLQLFDAIWHVAFEMMRITWRQDGLRKYLEETYFQEVGVQNLAKVFKRVAKSTWNRTAVRIAGHWYGVLGTAPGTGSGSLTLEALHSSWEREIRNEVRSNVFQILPKMQGLYEKWKTTFAWGENCSFDHYPKGFDESLLNGAPLRGAGRSPAVDFWTHRAAGNYVEKGVTTGDPNDGEVMGVTTLYVMRAIKVGSALPAKAVITAEVARHAVQLVCAEGPALEKTLQATGIVSGSRDTADWRVHVEQIECYLVQHCVVITGHLGKAYWPRFRRNASTLEQAFICTCKWFVQHASCEHVYFVQALRGGLLSRRPETEKRENEGGKKITSRERGRR